MKCNHSPRVAALTVAYTYTIYSIIYLRLFVGGQCNCNAFYATAGALFLFFFTYFCFALYMYIGIFLHLFAFLFLCGSKSTAKKPAATPRTVIYTYISRTYVYAWQLTAGRPAKICCAKLRLNRALR